MDLNPAAINDNVPLYNMSGLNGLPNQPTSAASAFPAVRADGNIPLRGTAKQRWNPRIRPTVQRPAKIDMWNATVEHQLTSTMTGEVSYVGN